MLLIDREYFVGPRNIPNRNSVDSGAADLLDFSIQRYEPDFFIKIFGYDFYQTFLASLAAFTIDQRWIDLRDGVTFNYGGYIRRWRGFVKHGTDVRSCVADYIYYWYMRNNATQTMQMGEVLTSVENSVPIDPSLKLSAAWYSMREDLIDLYDYLVINHALYPEFNQMYRLNSLCYDMDSINQFGI